MEWLVKTEEVSQRLGGVVALDGVSITVPTASLYALLGPSGSGKTTLFTALLGLHSITSGRIVYHPLLRRRAQVGYMPQETGLTGELTVAETLEYYGRLMGLARAVLRERASQLAALLCLPPSTATISTLSGGEEKRVSLAAALIHKPILLILDEPTVGADPIIRHSIWEYLMDLTHKEGTTILISTHYVEEANHAHKVGLMRRGRLVTEGSPTELAGGGSLEEAFLRLITVHTSTSPIQAEKLKAPSDKNAKVEPHFERTGLSISRVSAQIMKNIIWIKRNPLMMSFLFLLPLVQSLLYTGSFGHNPPGLKLILASGELALASTGLTVCSDQSLSHPVYTSPLNCSLTAPFTCQLANRLGKSLDIELREMGRGWEEEAERAVRASQAWGYASLSHNYTTALLERLYWEVETPHWDLEASQLVVRLDMSNYVVSLSLQRLLTAEVEAFMSQLAASCRINNAFVTSPLKVMEGTGRKERSGDGKGSPADSGLPGFISSFSFYFALLFTTGSLMAEKSIGVDRRNRAAGLGRGEAALATALVSLCLSVVEAFIMFAVFYLCGDFPLLGSSLLIFLILLSVASLGLAAGYLLTEVFTTERLVIYAGIGATLAVFSLGGIIWPIEGAHWLVKSWLWAAPVSPAVRAYTAVASKGYSLRHPLVYEGLISCLAWVSILSLAALLVPRLRG